MPGRLKILSELRRDVSRRAVGLTEGSDRSARCGFQCRLVPANFSLNFFKRQISAVHVTVRVISNFKIASGERIQLSCVQVKPGLSGQRRLIERSRLQKFRMKFLTLLQTNRRKHPCEYLADVLDQTKSFAENLTDCAVDGLQSLSVRDITDKVVWRQATVVEESGIHKKDCGHTEARAYRSCNLRHGSVRVIEGNEQRPGRKAVFRITAENGVQSHKTVVCFQEPEGIFEFLGTRPNIDPLREWRVDRRNVMKDNGSQ